MTAWYALRIMGCLPPTTPLNVAWLLVGAGGASGRSTSPAGGQGDSQARAQFQPLLFLSLCTRLQ